jgi:hypothetical protein
VEGDWGALLLLMALPMYGTSASSTRPPPKCSICGLQASGADLTDAVVLVLETSLSFLSHTYVAKGAAYLTDSNRTA